MAPRSQAARRARKQTGRSGSQKQDEESDCLGKSDATPSVADNVLDQDFAQKCELLRTHYASEWWWLMDPSIEAIGAQLQTQGYVVIDGFLGPSLATRLRDEVKSSHMQGKLSAAALTNGRTDESESKYMDTKIRGDLVGWFGSDEESWPPGPELHAHLTKSGTLVRQLKEPCPELAKVAARSPAMVACYPGGGARYIKHVDNDGKHPLCSTRILTALIYLNEGWKTGDGGELVIFQQEKPEQERRVVEPLFDRLLLFWSDHRNPHEVRPTSVMRYSVTVWLLGDANTRTEFENCAKPMPVAPPNTAVPSVSEDRVQCEEQQLVIDQPPHNPRDIISSDAVNTCKGNAERSSQDSGNIRYAWLHEGARVHGFSDIRQTCELQIDFDVANVTCCPVLEISETQVRVTSNGNDTFEPLLCLPLPFPNEPSSSSALPKWSQRRRRLTVEFEPSEAAAPLSTLAADLAEQLKQKGWGMLDSFLCGPDADDLRNFVMSEWAAGNSGCGSKTPAGPVDVALQCGEYRFVDPSALTTDAATLSACARRINMLIANFMTTHRVACIHKSQMSQGIPMISVCPGDGSERCPLVDAINDERGNNHQLLALFVCLNPFWREAAGGCFRFLENGSENTGREETCTYVQPLHGRLVAILGSNRCLFELMPSWAEHVAAKFQYYNVTFQA